MFSSFQFLILGIDVIVLLHFTWSPNTACVCTSPTGVSQGWEERASICCDKLWYLHCRHIFASSEVLSSLQRKETVYRGLHSHCKWEALDSTSMLGKAPSWIAMKCFFVIVDRLSILWKCYKSLQKGIQGYINHDQT